jgi:hypothetical protein
MIETLGRPNTCFACGHSGTRDSFQETVLWERFNLFACNLAICPHCAEILCFDENYSWEGAFNPNCGEQMEDLYFREAMISDLLNIDLQDHASLDKLQKHIRSNRKPVFRSP